MSAKLRCGVVLCTWNGERFLSQQLDSLRSQLLPADEYVLSDDASTDGSWALLEAFAAEQHVRGAHVVLNRNTENLGYIRHFEQALVRANSDLLFLCDQDDIWHADKLLRMREIFLRDPGLLVLHADARMVDGDGVSMGRDLFDVLEVGRDELDAVHAGDAFRVLLRRNIVTGAAMALRREVVALSRPFAEQWSHDEWMAINAAMRGRVDTLEQQLVDYRQHGGNQIGAQARTAVQRHVGVGVERAAYQRRQVLRLQELLAHAQHTGVETAMVKDRLLHAEARATLPGSMLMRLPCVAREYWRGGYKRYGSGLRSAVVDLLGLD